jgi:hypothetical protein
MNREDAAVVVDADDGVDGTFGEEPSANGGAAVIGRESEGNTRPMRPPARVRSIARSTNS